MCHEKRISKICLHSELAMNFIVGMIHTCVLTLCKVTQEKNQFVTIIQMPSKDSAILGTTKIFYNKSLKF